jgi:hypothetical protein
VPAQIKKRSRETAAAARARGGLRRVTTRPNLTTTSKK